MDRGTRLLPGQMIGGPGNAGAILQPPGDVSGCLVSGADRTGGVVLRGEPMLSLLIALMVLPLFILPKSRPLSFVHESRLASSFHALVTEPGPRPNPRATRGVCVIPPGAGG